MSYRFPPIKFVTNSIPKQILHIASELWEVVKAGLHGDWQHMCVELYDVIHSCETLIRILVIRKGIQPMQAKLKAQDKNDKRGYYILPLALQLKFSSLSSTGTNVRRIAA